MINTKLSPYTQTLRGGGTNIPADSDLNTLAFLEPGYHHCATSVASASLINCPTKRVFRMAVERITDDTSDWSYLVRMIQEATATGMYRQYVYYRRQEPDNISYGPWYKIQMEEVTT